MKVQVQQNGYETNRRANARVRKILGPQVEMQVFEGGAMHNVRARITDYTETGFGFSCAQAVSPGSVITFDDEMNQTRRARVTWCQKAPKGPDYRFGTTFEVTPHVPPEDSSSEEVEIDYYELLQINPKADIEMIHRVYRLQAQRFHPDNRDTGDASMFKLITKAYRTLHDPETRAAYDLKINGIRQKRWKIFDQPLQAVGVAAEKRKRLGILGMLYTKRAQEPATPHVSVREFEDLLGVPKEHLEFSLWYLRESGCLTRTDNGKYAITVKGIDELERSPEYVDKPTQILRDDRLLT